MAKVQEEKLPKTFKTKFIKALKSGEYNKGMGRLRSDDDGEITWCCLGVAADICGIKNLGTKDFIEKGLNMKGISKVPNILKGRVGIAEELAELNDKSDSFEPVIEYIEKNL